MAIDLRLARRASPDSLRRRSCWKSAAPALTILGTVLCLSGCFLPSTGPGPNDIHVEAAEHHGDPGPSVAYSLIPLTKQAVEVVAANEPKGFSGTFKDRKPPSVIRFGVGDVLSVSVFESASGGLYIPSEAGVRPGNYVTLPEQTVDNNGNISVPYAGTIPAAGRTNIEVQNEIVKRIAPRAIEPQAIVNLAQQRTNLVSVFGEVNSPLRFPAAYAGAGDRITDALTRAGGIKAPGYETWVILERNKRRGLVPFENLILYPENNIYVQPGDQIYVFRQPQKFIAFGAAGQQGVFTFDAWKISMAEAVAKARGLVDNQADPASIYLYRRESRAVAEALGVNMDRFPTDEAVPIIYTISFNDPAGYFLATQMRMRDQDVIFIANAPSVEVGKFLQLLALLSASGQNGALTYWYSSH
jgi:polysaccharide biosynthesis/export protein